MIGKLKILFRIKHLKQGGRWIAPVVRADLVDLIHHENRVIGADNLQSMDDAARHGADIGATVAADFRFITHAAQGEPIKFTAHGPGD